MKQLGGSLGGRGRGGELGLAMGGIENAQTVSYKANSKLSLDRRDKRQARKEKCT